MANIIDESKIGTEFELSIQVSEKDTAIVAGSGDLPVLATPVMLALMEGAAMKAVAPLLPEGMTTVGGHIESSHLRPSKIGSKVSAKATLTKIEGKKLFFDICATQDDTVIGKGTHLRFIVDRKIFMEKI